MKSYDHEREGEVEGEREKEIGRERRVKGRERDGETDWEACLVKLS